MKRVTLVLGLNIGFALLAGCSAAAPAVAALPPTQAVPAPAVAPKDAPEAAQPSATAAPVETDAPPEAAGPPAGELLAIGTDSQGAVEVIVAPQFARTGAPMLAFKVTLDTHLVELDFDLAALAELKTDTGMTLAPVKWDAPLGGHHVEGVLSFPAQVDGKPVLAGARRLILTIKGLDAPLRTFTWEW